MRARKKHHTFPCSRCDEGELVWRYSYNWPILVVQCLCVQIGLSTEDRKCFWKLECRSQPRAYLHHVSVAGSTEHTLRLPTRELRDRAQVQIVEGSP